MSATAPDRRVRRTRAALQQAMIDLVNEHGYEAISIDGLATRADVTRATFYAHYASKAELLTAVVDTFADDVIAAFDDPGLIDRPLARLEILLERARAQGDVLRIIVRGEGDGAPLRRFTDRVRRVLADDLIAAVGPDTDLGIDRELLVGLRAAQVVAAVDWYVGRGAGVEVAGVAAAVLSVIEQGWSRARIGADGRSGCPTPEGAVPLT